MKKVGLYFGTFNPIHVGHLIFASYMAQHTDLQEVWLVVSPQNPHKQRQTLLADHHRLALVREAIQDTPFLKVTDLEFHLPRPSYTALTLATLVEKYPHFEFSLLLGEDNLRSFHKWKNYESILANHRLMADPRVYETHEESRESHPSVAVHPNVQFVDAPVIQISSSFIREAIANGKDVQYFLTPAVWKYIDEMNFYR